LTASQVEDHVEKVRLRHAPLLMQQGDKLVKAPNMYKRELRNSKCATTYGPPELGAWRVAPGVFWIQTTDPRFSRKLEKRDDTRRVEVTGVNHFRRTFELPGTWRKIRRIIDRYVSDEVTAGDRFSPGLGLQNASRMRGSINIADDSNRRSAAVLDGGVGQ
jgi:hypothetical protein